MAEPQVDQALSPEAPPQLEPRFFRPADLESLLDHLQATFGRWPSVDIDLRVAPIDHLRWKLRIEDDPPPLHCVAEARSRVVAAEVIFYSAYKAKDRVIRVFESNDTSVHPDYQGRGLARRNKDFVMDEIRRLMACDLYLTSNRSAALSHVTRRRVRRGPLANVMQALVRPLTLLNRRPRRGWPNETRSRIRHTGRYLAWPALRLLGRRAHVPGTAAVPLVPAAAFDRRIDAFCATAAAAFDFIHLRDAAYMNWRFADPRAGAYRKTLAEERGDVAGYSVLSASQRRVRVAELLALPGRLDVVASLVDDAVAYAISQRASTVECWLPAHHPYQALLRARGFYHSHNAVYEYEACNPEVDVSFLDDPLSSIHLTLGDTDLV